MFQLLQHPDYAVRYYGHAYGIVSDKRSGARLPLKGDYLRVFRNLEQAIGLNRLMEFVHSEKDGYVPAELVPVHELLNALFAQLSKTERSSYQTMLQRMKGFNEYTMEHRIPLLGMIEVTYRCNLRCKHCYILHKVEQQQPETLGEEEGINILESLASLGCLDVTLSGGELTLNPAWHTFVKKAKDLGLCTTMKTNGLTFTPKTIAAYAENPAHSTHLSLYGSTPESHEEITGRAGTFAKTIQAMEELAKVGIVAEIFSLVWKGNLQQVDDMKKLIEDLGHRPVFMSSIHGRLNGDRTPTRLRITAAENLELVDRGLVDPFDVAPCTAGRTKMKIDPSGRVSICEYLDPSFGKVGSACLAALWNGTKLQTFGDRMITLSTSEKVDGKPVRSCPGLNLLNTGSVRGLTVFDM